MLRNSHTSSRRLLCVDETKADLPAAFWQGAFGVNVPVIYNQQMLYGFFSVRIKSKASHHITWRQFAPFYVRVLTCSEREPDNSEALFCHVRASVIIY